MNEDRNEWQEIRYNTNFSRFTSFYAGKTDALVTDNVGIEWRVKNGLLLLRGRAQKTSNLAVGDVVGFFDGLYLPVSCALVGYLSSSGLVFFALDGAKNSPNSMQLRVVTVVGTNSANFLLSSQAHPIM